MIGMKETMSGWVDTPLMKKVEGMGGWGAKFVGGMRSWADEPATTGEAAFLSAGLSKYLYGTHLAGNLGSVLLAMTKTVGQTLTTYGMEHTAKGWAMAFSDLAEYTGRRAQQGWKALDPLEREKLQREVFPITTAGPDGTDPIGLWTKVQDTLEGTFQGSGLGRSRGGGKNLLDKIVDPGLALFQKADWFDRLANGYAHLSWAKERGFLPKDLDLRAANIGDELRKAPVVVADMQRSVQEHHFGNDPLNVLDVFQPGHDLGNPLMRQFATFTLRSVLTPFTLSQNLAGGTRFFRGTTKAIPLPAGVVDFGRILGSSAMIYEIGKNLINTDLTGYTGYAQVTSGVPFMREGRFNPDGDPIPITPPIFDIPVEGAKALLTGDTEMFKRQLWRLLPYGVAAGRFTKYGYPGISGLLGQLGSHEGDVQREVFGDEIKNITGSNSPMADYGNPTPQGLVPLYSPDGSLIDYRSPTQLILQGLGVPVPDAQVPELDHYLTRNAEAIAGYRQQAIDYLLSGNMSGYEGVSNEFSKRFSFKGADGQKVSLPLSISRGQIKARAQLRTTARSQRIIGRITPDLRPEYTAIAGAYGNDRFQPTPQAQSNNEKRVAQVQAAEQAPTRKEDPFPAFAAYGDARQF
jgi:hypothetical protein